MFVWELIFLMINFKNEVPTPGGFKCFGIFNFLIDGRQFTLSRKHDVVKLGCQFLLIAGTVKPFIKTASIEIGESALHFLNNGDGNLIIGFLMHQAVMKDKLILIFDNADFQAQFHRYPGFAFADPFGVRFK